MPTFTYAGKHRSGRHAQGELEAQDIKDALRRLREREIAVTQLREQSKRTAGRAISGIGGWRLRLGPRDRAVLTHQWGTLLDAGVPLLTSLEMLATSIEPEGLRSVVSAIRQDVEKGMMVSASLRRYPSIFPDWYVHMVEVGEATGLLDRVLLRLAAYEERCAARKKKLLAALTYPAVLVGIATLVLLGLLIWIVPLFERVFVELGGALPWLTRFVIDGSLVVRTYGGGGLLLLILIGGGLWAASRTARGRWLIDRWLLGVPIAGEVMRKSAAAHFAETLGILLKSGVPILEGLRMTATSMSNAVMAQVVHAARIEVSQGMPVSETLSRSGVFPAMVTQMIAIGEASGALDSMLEKIATLYEQETTHTIAALTTLLEPLLILLVGLGIGILVVAMYLPIFTMGSLIG